MEGFIEELSAYPQVYMVCDRNVEEFARLAVEDSIPENHLMTITADEEHKTIDTVMEICRWLLAKGADRNALLLAVGGGVTTDLAGFAACIYKRGVRYANVPTTLLSMVDAAIGGKTGCNLDSYKNLLGVICQPEFTAIFPEALQTLPERELRSGYAELLKTFIIDNSSDSYDTAVELGARLFSGRGNAGSSQGDGKSGALSENGKIELEGDALETLVGLIQEAGAVKQRIVDEDEFEQNVRRKLNLGHTWGHAIEWWQHTHGVADPCTHGEAVAIGMVQAAEFAEKDGIAEEGLAARIAADLRACGLPTELPCPLEELLPAIRKDKKAEGEGIRLALPARIGEVVILKRVI